jgi:DNA polymerase-4
MHLAEAARRCPRAIFRDGDAQAANRLRDGVTRALLAFSPRVEVASIDDFFVDLTGTVRLHGPVFVAAERMHAAIRESTRLPVTIGVGTSKLVARLAGKLAKPGGIAEILPGGEQAFLGPLPVEHLPGVGHVIGLHLERFAIRTVGELRLVPREILFASFGRGGLELWSRARAIDEEPVEATHALDEEGRLIARPPRSIQRETTFEPEEGRAELVLAMLAYLVERAATRLRSQELVARTVEVRLRYVDTRARVEPRSPHDASAQGLSAAKRRTFAAPSDSTDELVQAARELFGELPRRRALVKRIGVTLSSFGQSSGWQGRMFDEHAAAAPAATSRADRQRRVDHALDALRRQHGFGRILRGSTLPLVATHPLRPDGFRLRTPSLNQ